jgi:hypothetical protein
MVRTIAKCEIGCDPPGRGITICEMDIAFCTNGLPAHLAKSDWKPFY